MGLIFTQQNILHARSGGANQITPVVNFDATEIAALKLKRWPSFQRDVLGWLHGDFSLRLCRVLPADHSRLSGHHINVVTRA